MNSHRRKFEHNQARRVLVNYSFHGREQFAVCEIVAIREHARQNFPLSMTRNLVPEFANFQLIVFT